VTPPSGGSLNIGILAHVDAGKTTLTERLLFDSGAIDRLGSVDEGTTQTDSDEIERRRGITIRAAVTSFTTDGLQINVIDTPGHPEFIAEVERSLRVLDGVVLVVSAVEGVQAQTRVLARTLRAVAIPTVVFVNKIDRGGARGGEVVEEVQEALGVPVARLNAAYDVGTRHARATPLLSTGEDLSRVLDVLVDTDDELLERVLDGTEVGPQGVWARLAAATRAAAVYPAILGSARTGEGVADLLRALRCVLPRAAHDVGAAPDGTVFAIERGKDGERAGYLRLRGGTLHERQRLTWFRSGASGVTSYVSSISHLSVVGAPDRTELTAGNIARVRGVVGLKVGDSLGAPDTAQPHFARPTLEAVVTTTEGTQASRLHTALMELADQDPLISARTLPGGRLSVLLYGDVQKQVLQEVLLVRYGLETTFEDSLVICIERPVGRGRALVELGKSPFVAGVGLRVEPGRKGSGVRYVRESKKGALPGAFETAIRETIFTTLDQGLCGWPLTDCVVALVDSGFDNACSTGGDFRGLTPLVLMSALQRAGSAVYEPCHAFEATVPLDALSAVTSLLIRCEASISATNWQRSAWQIQGEIPSRMVNSVKLALPGLTSGEGSWWSHAQGDRPVHGEVPRRERTDGNPLNPSAYMRYRMLGKR